MSDKLLPAKEKHSIVESIFLVFLANPIINPRRFQSLVEKNGPLHDKFQRFQIKRQQQFTAEYSKEDIIKPALQFGNQEDVGFSLESYSEGNIDWIVKYEALESHNVLAFHSFNYPGWDTFIGTCSEYLQILSEFDNSLYAHMMGLTYKDEFSWLDEQNMDWKILFKENNDYIPRIIFEGLNDWSYNCTHQINLNGLLIFENIAASAQRASTTTQLTSITHSTGYSFNEAPFLVEGHTIKDKIRPIIDQIHDLNKGFLAKCLQEDILKRIGIITNNNL